MEMDSNENQIERSNLSKQPSESATKHGELLGWIMDQLQAAAIAKGQVFSSERLRINAEDLIDIPQDRLAVAFTRARRELDYAPDVSKLRRLAGADDESKQNAEADAAWNWANAHLQRWGVDQMPLYRGKTVTYPPAIPNRIDYALRRIGGLTGLNQITEDRRPFAYKDFCEAFNLYPIAQSLQPQFDARYAITGPTIKQLTAGPVLVEDVKPEPTAFKPKPIPRQDPLNEAEIADRREMLRQQAEKLKDREKSA